MAIICCHNCGICFSSHAKICPKCKTSGFLNKNKGNVKVTNVNIAKWLSLIRLRKHELLMISTLIVFVSFCMPVVVDIFDEIGHSKGILFNANQKYPKSFKDGGVGHSLIVITGPNTFNFYLGEENTSTLSHQELMSSNLRDVQVDYELMYSSTYTENNASYKFLMKSGYSKALLSPDFHEKQFMKSGDWFEYYDIDGKIQYIPCKNYFESATPPNKFSKGWKDQK